MQLSCRCSAIGSGTAMSGGRARAPSTCSLRINSRRNTRITSTFSVFFCFFLLLLLPRPNARVFVLLRSSWPALSRVPSNVDWLRVLPPFLPPPTDPRIPPPTATRADSVSFQRSALGLLGLLKAASEGDARLYTLRVSTESMGSGTAARGAGVQGHYLPPSLRRMEVRFKQKQKNGTDDYPGLSFVVTLWAADGTEFVMPKAYWDTKRFS